MTSVQIDSSAGNRLPLIQPKAADAPSATTPMKSVSAGLMRSTISMPPVTSAAWRLPHAPSMVLVEVAASLATSVKPRSRIAWLNSWAVISPFAIASRKFPVYAPFLSRASWSLPDAPGIASANWFQFSVVSFP